MRTPDPFLPSCLAGDISKVGVHRFEFSLVAWIDYWTLHMWVDPDMAWFAEADDVVPVADSAAT